MNRKRILVVDDDAVVRKTLLNKLGAAGYEVLLANDGAGAMSSVRLERPDLILLDISFPPDVAHGGGVSWDGFLLASWLQRMEEAKGIPIILISGHDSPENIQRARKAAVAGFFPKPINLDGLTKAIAALIGDLAATSQAV